MNIFLVSGISGAGKTVFVKTMEDIGFYCVDNLPVPLLSNFIQIMRERKNYDNVAVVVDIREKDYLSLLEKAVESIKKESGYIRLKIVFLDARDEILLRRYSETRRKHPVDTYDIEKGIEEERKLLKWIRDQANYVIDTTDLTSYQLKKKAEEIVQGKVEKMRVSLKIMSFGYKYGVPIDADIIFDMRFLPNPFYVPELKDKTGLDSEVKKFLESMPQTKYFEERALELVRFMIENFDKEGKNFINLTLGCTGGRHRSVYMAERFYEDLRQQYNEIIIAHRDLGR